MASSSKFQLLQNAALLRFAVISCSAAYELACFGIRSLFWLSAAENYLHKRGLPVASRPTGCGDECVIADPSISTYFVIQEVFCVA